MSPEATAEKIEQAQFRPVMLKPGYDMSSVDRLLDALVAAVGEGRPLRPLLDSAQLKTVSWREGYRKEDVDRLLDELRSEA